LLIDVQRTAALIINSPPLSKKETHMKSLVLWGLIIINALLLASFIGRYWKENAALAQAQPGAAGGPRRPGDYLMISGEVTGGNTGVVYLVDQNNGWLGAMAFDDTRNTLDVMPRIDMNRAFDAAMQQRGPAAPANNRTGHAR
jgi:hypothetical protein